MEQYKGLTEKEAAKTLVNDGENIINVAKKNSMMKIFAGQFRDAMILILLAATAISALMGETAQAYTIIAIVFLNAVLGFFQEYRTEKTLERLKEMSAPHATVMRDGKVQSIDACNIVREDIVLVKAGDRVPSDCLILQQTDLMTDESMLSGESDSVTKEAANSSAHDKKNMIFMGTMVTKGKGVCRVIATGSSTEMGKIADMLSEIEVQSTPLQKRLSQLSKYIGIGCLIICAIVALSGILRGEDVFQMLLTGISLSVAAVPEGLPAIVTIALALSISRMVKQNALVRRLHAVETLGCANIICSDKTGTLTENKMTVKAISTYDYQVDITGSAQTAIGEFKISGKKADVLQSYSLSMLFDIAVMCNNAAISEKQPKSKNSAATKDTTLEVFGEPTETALLVMAAKAGLYREKLSYSIEKEIPFDSTRKMMSVVVKQKHGSRLIFSKGAPDILLSKCSYCLTKEGVKILTPAMSKAILKSNNSMAESALRVLGFAYRIVNSEHDTAEKDLVFVGLAGLLDPPRREAYEAVATCRKAHIKPIMITGDYELTAKAIAKDLKIFTAGDEIVSGKELDTMSDDALKNRLNNISVFARVTPAHKLKIVRALKAQGNIVAMTGDGVNDAPAIKEADIGVAMGISGTDVTKEAASVILLDDNFATLVSAVKEGRIIYQNIRKFIRYLLSCNIGEVITMFFAMLMGMPIPLLPIQILLINLVTDGLPAIALGLEPGEPDVMKRKPRRANESIFSGGLSTTIVIRGFLIGLTTLAVFSKLLSIGSGIEAARTGALLTLVATQLIHVFECKSETRSIFSINPFNNIKLIMAVLISGAAVLIAIYIPEARLIFATAPLTFEQIIISLGYCAVVPIISSVLLILRSKKTTKRPQHSKKTQTDMLF